MSTEVEMIKNTFRRSRQQKDDHNNIYTKNADGNYVDSGAGLVYKATGEKDSDGNEYYVYTAPDGQEAKIAMKNETTNYYQADVAQKGYTEYTDNDWHCL